MASPSTPVLAYGFAKSRGIVILSVDEIAHVAMREGAEPAGLAEVRRVAGKPLAVERISASAFDRKLQELYGGEGLVGATGAESLEKAGDLNSLVEDLPAAADLLDTQDDAPIIRLINAVLADSVRRGASDIHIEPFESGLVIRMRVDGVLKEVLRLPQRLTPLLVSRVKVMARLDIAEKRIPQDGRISVALGGRTLDVRVSTLPARAGERVVMRILDREQANLAMEQLGMPPGVLALFRAALNEPNGIILVTGPTGSGKTTTLYAGLSALNDQTRNILTIEDPVEYAIDGVGQTQVNTKVGMTFAAGLRAVLRQDPDVVMVGEIRDVETARIAVQASLTGHLVLSTVHTNDAPGAITRLRDMGVEPFLLASTLRLIMAQRLVRRLCPHCRQAEKADEAAARSVGLAPGTTIYRAKGCAECGNTGYLGRLGVYEAVRVDEKIRKMIADNADEALIAASALAVGPNLAAAARAYVAEGITTVEEAFRVTRQEAETAANV